MQQDRVSGASEIEQKIIEFISPYLGTEELFEKCRELLSTYPSMASLWNIANFAFLHEEGAKRHFNEMIEAGKQVVYQGVHAVKKHVTVLTHSRSATLSKILLACADKGITVICSESRPGYEGRKLAGELSEGGIEVVITTDAELFSHVDEADMVMVGADAILTQCIVNKTGTSALALYAREKEREVYVVSSSYKAFPFVFLKEENGEEVWKEAPHRVTVVNRYFDVTPLSHITHFITENGISDAPPSFHFPVADEIQKIKKIISPSYMLVE